MAVKVSPDLMFFTDKGIEVVFLKASKPKITMKSSIQDKGANTNLELYALLQYGNIYYEYDSILIPRFIP